MTCMTAGRPRTLQEPLRKKYVHTPTNSYLYSRQQLRGLGLLLRGADVGVVHLGCELETGDGFLQVGLQRADHDEHERFGVAAEGVLQEVCQL